MNRPGLWFAAALGAASSASAEEPKARSHAAGVDIFASSDADATEVSRVGLNFDWKAADPEHYRGLRLETARFRPLGQPATTHHRAYYRFADQEGDWSWNGQAGTDSHTVLGAVAIHNERRFRQEYFVEREIVETPNGVSRGIYYTLAGGALDLPINERNHVTVLAAAQAFTGRNVRLHIRANSIHVLQEDWGLSVQLRGRYFQSSHPGEFDYFSPKTFAQILPTVQLRRRLSGWRYVVAGGLGAQRQTGTGWSSARALNAQVTSPPFGAGWALEGAFAYSNTPVDAGNTYDYRQVTLGIRRAF